MEVVTRTPMRIVGLEEADWEVVLTAMMQASIPKERDYINGRVFQEIKRQLESINLA